MSNLEVPGASLAYQTVGDGPLVVFIAGARGEGAGFHATAQHLASRYKVLTYDRRGYQGSRLNGPQDYGVRLKTDAEDVACLIRAETDRPAIVCGSSSGAIVALQVLSDHAERVDTLVAHEPPAIRRLPPEQADALIASNYRMYDTYREAGVRAALGPFMMEVLSDSDRKAIAENASRADPADIARNFDYWFEHELRQYPATVFDDAKLRSVGDRLIFVAGEETVDLYPHHIAALFAKQLGVPLEILAGGHLGYTTHPEAFAEGLSALLAARSAAKR